MVGHHEKFVEENVVAQFAHAQPFAFDDVRDPIRFHLVVFNRSEKWAMMIGANRDEIRAVLCIIVTAKTCAVAIGLENIHNASREIVGTQLAASALLQLRIEYSMQRNNGRSKLASLHRVR